MSKIKNYKLLILVILLAISFTLIQICSGIVFGRHKKDVTSFHRYADKQQSLENIKNMNTPVNITLYMSENLSEEYPSLGAHSQYVLRILEKFQSYSNGKINIMIKDPQPYSITEKEAVRNNMRPFPNINGDGNLYFGASFISEKGEKEIIPYFSTQRQNYTEYDISRILNKLSGNFKKQTVGIVNFYTKLNNETLFLKQLKNDYDVVKIDRDDIEIPLDIDVLIIFNPQYVSRTMIYAIDQYILRGGKLVILTDPHSEYAAKQNPSSNLYKNGIEKILDNIGIEYNHEEVIGDGLLSKNQLEDENALVTHIELFKENINSQIPFMKDILKLNFNSPGSLVQKNKETAVYTPLLYTSNQAGTINASLSRFGSIDGINNAFKSQEKSYVLAYLIEGWFESLFEDNIIGNTPQAQGMLPFIIGSIEKAQIIVIADTDFLENSAWNDTSYDEDATVYDLIPSANNSDLLLNIVDYLTGNHEMLGIAPNYLYSMDKTAGEQLYDKIYEKYAERHKYVKQKLISTQKELELFKSDLRTGKITSDIGNIKEIEDINRTIISLKEELKHFEYILKTIQEHKINTIIFNNIVIIPLVIILLLIIGMCIYNRRHQKKIMRIINER